MDDGKDADSTSSDVGQATGNGDQVRDDAADVAGITASASGANPESPARVPSPPNASELLAAELLGVLNDFAARVPGLSSPHKSTAPERPAPSHDLEDLHAERDLHHRGGPEPAGHR